MRGVWGPRGAMGAWAGVAGPGGPGGSAARSLRGWGPGSGGNRLWGVGPTPTVFLLDQAGLASLSGEYSGGPFKLLI